MAEREVVSLLSIYWSGWGEKKAVILRPNGKGGVFLEQIGGEEVIKKGSEEGLLTDKWGSSGLAQILAEAIEADVIKLGDDLPKEVLPEVGIAYMDARNDVFGAGYFHDLARSRDITTQMPREMNPLIFSRKAKNQSNAT